MVATPQKKKTGVPMVSPQGVKTDKVRVKPATPSKDATPVKSPHTKKTKVGSPAPILEAPRENAVGPGAADMEVTETLPYDPETSLDSMLHVKWSHIRHPMVIDPYHMMYGIWNGPSVIGLHWIYRKFWICALSHLYRKNPKILTIADPYNSWSLQ